MGFIEDELQEVSQLCERVIEGSRLVTCLPSLVRVDIVKSSYKTVTACIQFPKEYPNNPLLLELKSKTLSDKLLQGLTDVCEKKAKEIIGKPQVIKTLQLLRSYISENPLCCCFDELNAVKKVLGSDGSVKLKQKISSVALEARGGLYYFRTRISVPEDYPKDRVSFEDIDSNFPDVFIRYMIGQAREIARRCVEPPLRTPKGPRIEFKPSPSFQGPTMFLVHSVQQFCKEICPVCGVQCLPDNPADAVKDEIHEKHVERVLCGHLYHQGCLSSYLREPPFPPGGKECPACSRRLQHERWGLCPRVAEKRWAHQQARDRELEEVKDFLQ